MKIDSKKTGRPSNTESLNPPERKQRLTDERVAEIGQIAAGMPHGAVSGWLGDLCADLFDARAQLRLVLDLLRARAEQDTKALFKRHGELAVRLCTGPPLSLDEEVELETIRCVLDVEELGQMWEGQRKRAEAAEAKLYTKSQT